MSSVSNVKVSETFSDRKFYLKHKLSTASLQSSTGKVIINYSTDIATGQWFTITTILVELWKQEKRNTKETGRVLETRKKEHKRNVKQCKSGSNIAKHAWTQNHNINFDECEVLDKATYRHRATLESWHTATTANSDNNAQHLPEQYRFLLEKNRS